MRATFTCGYFVKPPDQEVFSVSLLWNQNRSPVASVSKEMSSGACWETTGVYDTLTLLPD